MMMFCLGRSGTEPNNSRSVTAALSQSLLWSAPVSLTHHWRTIFRMLKNMALHEQKSRKFSRRQHSMQVGQRLGPRWKWQKIYGVMNQVPQTRKLNSRANWYFLSESLTQRMPNISVATVIATRFKRNQTDKYHIWTGMPQ